MESIQGLQKRQSRKSDTKFNIFNKNTRKVLKRIYNSAKMDSLQIYNYEI